MQVCPFKKARYIQPTNWFDDCHLAALLDIMSGLRATSENWGTLMQHTLQMHFLYIRVCVSPTERAPHENSYV